MSSNEMVGFPRELSNELAELIAEKARVCGGGAFEIWEAICDQFGTQAQHQGEPAAKAKPVAKLHAERMTGRDGEYGVTVEDSEWFNTCRLTGGIFNLYAEQPAPVAVVMPEQLIAAIEAEQERLSQEDYLMDSDECVKVIREEVARLNGMKM